MSQNIIDILGVNTLALRGKGTEFNRFSRFFQSKDDALESVATTDYVPTPGVFNAVLILGIGIAVYSFDLEDFVALADLQAAGNQANRYIDLDGANDYLEFSSLSGGSENVLDWSKNWSIGLTLVGLGPTTSDSKFMTLFSNGDNAIYLRRGGTNWGLYVTGSTAYTHGANTWYAPSATSRILLTYEAATSRLKYYLGEPATGSYAMRANLAVNSTVKSANNVGSSLCVGKALNMTAGYTGQQVAWDGGVNNLILSDQVLTGPQVDEFFQTGESFIEHEYYPDLTSYWRLGEDTYPNVVDSKGDSDGVLVNGAANDFVDIPTE
jgi:hypothetical protein